MTSFPFSEHKGGERWKTLCLSQIHMSVQLFITIEETFFNKSEYFCMLNSEEVEKSEWIHIFVQLSELIWFTEWTLISKNFCWKISLKSINIFSFVSTGGEKIELELMFWWVWWVFEFFLNKMTCSLDNWQFWTFFMKEH